jgi:SAM-dependent methyltransferase
VDLKRSYFNELAPLWDGFPSPPETPERLARFVALCVPAGTRRVLDAGCGTGVLVAPLLAGAVELTTVVEMDAADAMLAQNRGKLTDRRVVHLCGDALALPFRPGTFDAVLCFNALPHMAPLDDSLRNLLACLRAGGVLSVGHLMGSENLNAFHHEAGGAVAEDRLPSACDLACSLAALGAEILHQEEAPDWYLVQVRKCG